ncbi:MAG TPA: peptidase M19 [Deltaproteobacteria bacterium]|nr:peptidase M19 [Deltaproteobacteria bacterium]
MSWRRTAARYGAIVAVVIALLWLALALRLEGFVNRVEPVPLPAISPRARALHDTSFIADLHADSLLFGRDLLERSDLGHVDLPRLREGGVALQVFAVPTLVPFGLNIERNERPGLDALTFGAMLQLSPIAWKSPTDRALYRAEQMRAYVRASGGSLLLIENRGDLERLVAAGPEGSRIVGAMLSIEGAHAMEGDPDHLRTLFDAGYRMIGLTHFFDNEYAGSAHGVEKGGLTDLGRRTIADMEELGIIVDLAHLAPKAIDEVLDLARRPTVVSHTGVRATCDNRRNLSDEHIRRIAAGGGIIGIGYWESAVCGRAPKDIARAIAHVVRLVGADHAALGSDYDGGTVVGFDTTGLPALTQALVDEGLRDSQIRKILGENVLRIFSRTLPPAGIESD